ncbi:MAG: hypothetical protein MMC23_006712 [Stictis urceolatum]|nr:hypothetical protein [Stictis urceolata]
MKASFLSLLCLIATGYLAGAQEQSYPTPAPDADGLDKREVIGGVNKCLRKCPVVAPGKIDPCRQKCYAGFSAKTYDGQAEQVNAVAGTVLSKRDSQKLEKNVDNCSKQCKAKHKKNKSQRPACLKSCVLSRVKRPQAKRDTFDAFPADEEDFDDDDEVEDVQKRNYITTTSSSAKTTPKTSSTTKKTTSTAAAGSAYSLGAAGGGQDFPGSGGFMDPPAGADIDVYYIDKCYIDCFNRWAERGFCYDCWNDCLDKGKMVLIF